MLKYRFVYLEKLPVRELVGNPLRGLYQGWRLNAAGKKRKKWRGFFPCFSVVRKISQYKTGRYRLFLTLISVVVCLADGFSQNADTRKIAKKTLIGVLFLS